MRAAIDHAKSLGFSKKDVAFKRAKERLYGDTPTEFSSDGKQLVGLLTNPAPKPAAKSEPMDPRAAALAALDAASDEDSLRAAIDHAKKLGCSKKDIPFKRAKERLYGDTPTC